jgi:type IV secretion system protein VirD4
MFEEDMDNGFISQVARKLLDQYGEEKTEQWEWVMDAFTDAFSLYAEGSALRDSVISTDFDAGLLKERPQAIYIMVPDKYLDSHGDYLASVIEYLVSTIADAEGCVRTTFMLDEFVNIPEVQSMVKALRLYRSKGIRLWTFAQDRNGFNKYKKDGGYMPFEESSVSVAWGVTGSHARELSEKAGKHSVLIGTPNQSAGVSADTGGQATSEVQVPNLPVSQIAQNFSGIAILDTKSKIFTIDRKPYWEISWIQGTS